MSRRTGLLAVLRASGRARAHRGCRGPSRPGPRSPAGPNCLRLPCGSVPGAPFPAGWVARPLPRGVGPRRPPGAVIRAGHDDAHTDDADDHGPGWPTMPPPARVDVPTVTLNRGCQTPASHANGRRCCPPDRRARGRKSGKIRSSAPNRARPPRTGGRRLSSFPLARASSREPAAASRAPAASQAIVRRERSGKPGP
jgi:hypothetical protein